MNKNTLKFKITAIILVSATLVIALILLINLKNTFSIDADEFIVEISVDGMIIKELSIDENIEFDANVDNNINTVKLESGSVSMSYSNCPDGDCMSQPPIDKYNINTRALGNAIICLPHRVVVKLVESGSSDDLAEHER